VVLRGHTPEHRQPLKNCSPWATHTGTGTSLRSCSPWKTLLEHRSGKKMEQGRKKSKKQGAAERNCCTDTAPKRLGGQRVVTTGEAVPGEGKGEELGGS